MKKLILLISLCLWGSCFFYGCKEDDATPAPDEPVLPKIEVSDSLFWADVEAIAFKLRVITYDDWTITGSNDWCKTSLLSGNGPTEVVVTVLENTTGSGRENTLELTVTNKEGKQVVKKIKVLQKSSVELLTFGFERQKNPGIESDLKFDFSLLRKGKEVDTIFFSVPYRVDDLKLCPTFTCRGASVKIGEEIQTSGVSKIDFGISREYSVVGDSSVRKYLVVVQHFSGLPIVYINTENQAPIVSKDSYVNATLRIEENKATGSSVLLEVPMTVKGRGNSTWGMPKKPYKMKLNKKAEVLGMPADKEWVLLANYIDPSLVRNDLAFEVSERLQMAWTPRRKFVEVVLNGAHQGNYLLTEQIKIASKRVDVEEFEVTETSPEVITGGYLLELDTYYDEDWKFKSPLMNLPVMVKEPDIVQVHLDYLKGYFTEVENTIYGEGFKDSQNGWIKYLDEASFIDWWIIMETMGCWEPNHPKSCYMHKSRGGKLAMGPVWDFDWKEFGWETDRFYMKGRDNTTMPIWYARLFEDPVFLNKLKARYKSLRSNELSNLNVYMEVQRKLLKKSAGLNYQIWRQGSSNYDTELDAQLNFISGHLKWLDTHIPNL